MQSSHAKSVSWILVSIGAMLVPACTLFHRHVEFSPEPAVGILKSLGDKVRRVPAYEVVSPRTNEDEAGRRAEEVLSIFRGRAELPAKHARNGVGHVYQAGPLQFEIADATGAEILVDLDRYTRFEGQLPKGIEEKLPRLADDYIRRLFPDVRPEEVHFLGLKKIMDATVKLDRKGEPAGEISAHVANYIALYERRLDDIPVIGPGGKIRIYFSSTGEVIGHAKTWRELRRIPGSEKAVLSPSAVRAAFEKRHEAEKVAALRVDRLYFGYFAEGRYTRQQVLRPVYVIGYVTGPAAKRTFEMYDAVTGEDITPREGDETGADRR
ncbi:hypothetical protein G3N55_06415 [Dissulfurirhabdus thermomarina]|uniref:Uncharacterized protein n=1 Tax=Dissulfurirhabdus thermomarina TaxID=1765737 RepID=A0A6N9TMK9_DISTH|nr:hypothetical protein [Dissulfurirhabdus thermomarina]NDY42475.1 hypothetical protein [Dissulfurirhabdus thermomarina]